MRLAWGDLAFEAGLMGFALALYHYGMAVRVLNGIIRSKSGLWRGPLAGALLYVGAASLHAWGRFGLGPRVQALETALAEAASTSHLEALATIQARLDDLLSQLGLIRDLSFLGILMGSVLALAAGLSFLKATSK